MRHLIIVLGLAVWPLFAGVAEIVTLKNEVNVVRNTAVFEAHKGMALEEGDVINTFEEAMVRVRFSDETVVTLGKKSRFAIHAYLYDEQAPKTELGFTKGFFKIATGKIGKIAPERVTLKTRTATMGIRGTEIDGFVSREKEVITCTKGAIWVDANGKRVDLDEGESTIILPGQVPTEPKNYRYEKLIREGLAAFEAKEYEKSRSIFTELIGMDGENPVFYYYLGKSQFYLKNYTAAISSFKQVLLFDREHVKSHYELGVTYYILEEMQKAKEEFEVVIASHDKGQKIQPLTFVLSHYWLGKVHHFNGNTKAAVEYMKRVLEFKLKKDFRTKVEKELAKIKSGGE